MIDKKKNEFIFQGTLKGNVFFPPKGKHGFGYDPIFIPLNYNKTLAQVSPLIKNSLSHRKKAIAKLLAHNIFQYYMPKN